MLSIDEGVDVQGKRAVERLVGDKVCGAAHYVRQTPSTNSLALADVRVGGVDERLCPKLYLTDRQTAGRGRHGRNWLSSDGTLTCSLVVPSPSESARSGQLLALAVGVGVARSLEFEFAPLKTSLKWPNDVIIDGGKTAGILLETTTSPSRCVVVGIGVNVSRRPDLAGGEAAVGDLSAVVGRRIDRYEILPPLVEGVVNAIAQLEQFADDLVQDFRDRCWLTGQRVSFRLGATQCEGVCRGVSDKGELLMETNDGLQRVRSGEAHRVRIESSDGGWPQR